MDPALMKLLHLDNPPLSRVEAIRAGLLIDCTRMSTWAGFTVPAVMTTAAWDETIGEMAVGMTQAERDAMGRRLQVVWKSAMDASMAYRKKSVFLPSIRFLCKRAIGSGWVALRIAANLDSGNVFITLRLDGEV